ncbi:tail fiber [Stenotrophomonas phage Piffle]|uniref:Tail fiber n=1 Tax=Stenotrophomonas phage Piffle TaxID=2859656 RepID=A0AAE7WMS3_9CAUD|nr:tail fiber [Stenotrophomonas phage Piffle]QYW01940.1 tail fiber [Stenotrophomonas phage Piffle]
MFPLPDHSSRIICSEGPNPFRIEVAPGLVSFGNVVMNRNSTVHQVVVTNVGDCPVKIGSVRVAGSYRATSNKTGWLNPGEHFLIDVIFAPRVEGIHHGSLYVETNGASGTEYAALLGYGYAAGTDPGGGTDPGEGGEEGGIIPKYFSWIGDGIQTSFPLNGADAYNKYLFDTSQENTVGQKDFHAVNPSDYNIDPPVGAAPATIRFLTPPKDGTIGFAVLRGYAKPYVGEPPLTTVNPGVVSPPTPGTTVDGKYANSLIIVSDATPVRLEIRRNTGDTEKDWKKGDFFSVVQHNTGSVELAIGSGGTLFLPSEFIAKTRGRDATISATCINPDADQWLLSGDLLRGVLTTERHMVVLEDKSRLNGTSVSASTTAVDGIILPFGMKLDPIADGGLSACVLAPTTSGSILTMDIRRNGVSVLQSLITINNNQYTSATATTPPSFIPDGNVFAKGDRLEMYVTQAGAGARGPKVILMGMRQ